MVSNEDPRKKLNRAVRRSPTGRIPQWALNEAYGKPVPQVPFRGSSVSLLDGALGDSPRPRAPRWRHRVRDLAVVGGVIGLVAVASWAGVGRQLGLGAGPTIAAGQQQQGPPPGYEEGERTSPPQTWRNLHSDAYRFAALQSDRATPVTWSPCRPIHVVVRPDHAPVGGNRMLSDTLAEMSRTTGLRFVADGATTESPASDREAYQPDRYGDRWAPVLVAWASAAEVPDFGIDIMGEASAARAMTPSGDTAYISGVVYLDPSKIESMRLAYGEPAARSVLLHEFGHLVGLGHVNDPQQLMWPRASAQLTDFQAGDLAGLAQLGRGDCQPDI